MKLADVLGRFGSREELARWTGSTMRAVYQWQVDDAGRLVSRNVRRRVVMGLVLRTLHEAREEGRELPESDAALLLEDLEDITSPGELVTTDDEAR